ncbi:MAG: hypothetical protein P8M73_08895 [Luminiphilus sp.]|nr:hypothetical protein [Luminiphilus sp.]
MTLLSPFQQGIQLLSENNVAAARELLLSVRAEGGADAAAAARFLAYIDQSERRFSAAITTLLSSLEELGEDAASLAQLAELYMTLGKGTDAIAAAERALACEPDNAVTALNLTIWRSNYSDKPTEIKAAFEAWSAQFLTRSNTRKPLRSSRTTQHEEQHQDNAVIRIGYLSGDLSNHPVRYFIEPYFRAHDASRFDIHALMTGQEDEISTLLREWVPCWHNVERLEDDALVDYIRGLKIDILVDLSGHTEASRMGVFAARAAPVQVTWWGFVHTLGMPEIDYRLTDWVTCPQGSEAYYTESLCRMRCLTAYAPPVNCDNQYPAPWHRNQYVTMISLNHSRKISDAALDAWCDILNRNPNSGLIIVTAETSDTGIQEHFLPRLEGTSFPMDRVSAVPRLTLLEFMNVAAVADFALDSFPVSGGVTTLHALWMGLPVLALSPPVGIAMQSYSANTLELVGLNECVVQSVPELINRASQWIHQPSDIDALRDTIRPSLINSPFMDHAARVKELETCFDEMWRRFKMGGTVSGIDSETLRPSV